MMTDVIALDLDRNRAAIAGLIFRRRGKNAPLLGGQKHGGLRRLIWIGYPTLPRCSPRRFRSLARPAIGPRVRRMAVIGATAYASAVSSALASFRSAKSNPSVNQA
jgi:hypothetical protein